MSEEKQKENDSKNMTYKDAGVDVDAGAELVKRIKPFVTGTARRELLNSIGGFGSLCEIPSGYASPVLVSGADGVGTKLRLAIDAGHYSSVGQDLVAMSVNDVVVVGAEPFLFLDYFATGKLDLDVAEEVIRGIASACEIAGCSLGGGETAEMPGFYSDKDFDLAGFCVGVVEKARIIDGSKIREGDDIIGLSSSGPHSNGYSLIRKILNQSKTVASPTRIRELLAPTEIYVKPLLKVFGDNLIKGAAHVTGGGFFENIPRSLPDTNLASKINQTTWTVPEIFQWLQFEGAISDREMFSTFNCGVGMVLFSDPANTEKLINTLSAENCKGFKIGEVVSSDYAPKKSELLIR